MCHLRHPALELTVPTGNEMDTPEYYNMRVCEEGSNIRVNKISLECQGSIVKERTVEDNQ